MTAVRRIEALAAKPLAPPAPGDAPVLDWVAVARLVVEESYQRQVAERGVKNIRQIAENFRWSRFAPIVVAPRDDGDFAVIDGQHRAIAAATLGLDRLPAMIVEMSQQERAAAFTYINSRTTALTVMAKFHAAVAAGDGVAVAAAGCLAAAGARVLPYPVGAHHMKPGDTLAAGALLRAIRQFDAAALTLALRALVAQNEGGSVCAALILGFTRALFGQPALVAAPEATLQRLAAIDALDLLDKAEQERLRRGGRTEMIVAELLAKVLDPSARNKGADAAPDRPGTVASPPPLAGRSSPEATRPPVASRPITAPSAARPLSAPASLFSSGCPDAIFTQLCVKAGIAFGCTRQDVLQPADALQDRAQACVARYLADHGCPVPEIGRRLLLEARDVRVQIAAPDEFGKPMRERRQRFLDLVAEALKHAGMAA